MAVFWVILPCSVVKLTDVSETIAAATIRAMRDRFEPCGPARLVEPWPEQS